MTLADEDTNSILTDNANRAIQGNVAMQVTQVAPSGGQIWNLCKRRQLVAKLVTNASSATKIGTRSAIWRPNSQSMQVAPPSGQNWN